MEKLINITGKAISGEWGSEDVGGCGIPVLRTTNFTNEGKIDFTNVITRKITKNVDEKYLKKGDIIIEKSGGSSNQPVGRVVYYDNEDNKYLFNNFTGLLRVKDTDRWFPKYVFYSLFANYQNGGTVKYENKTTGIHNLKTEAYVKEFNVKVKDFDEQRKIVVILDKITDLINKRKQQLEKLDELVKSRFVEMFGEPVHNTKQWNTDELSKHLKVIGGYAFKSDLFKDTGIPVLRIGNINAGYFRPINMVFWEDDSQLDRYKLHTGDLVMSLTGTVGKNDYGNVCILDDEYDVYYLNQRNAKLELYPSLNKYYLSNLLKFDEIKKKLTGISRGVRQANISNRDILNLCIPVPPLNLQNQFAAFVEQVNKSKSEVKQALEKLETLKKALMQKYFG